MKKRRKKEWGKEREWNKLENKKEERKITKTKDTTKGWEENFKNPVFNEKAEERIKVLSERIERMIEKWTNKFKGRKRKKNNLIRKKERKKKVVKKEKKKVVGNMGAINVWWAQSWT